MINKNTELPEFPDNIDKIYQKRQLSFFYTTIYTTNEVINSFTHSEQTERWIVIKIK